MAEQIVVDANLCVALLIPLPYSDAVAQHWFTWKMAHAELYAPVLWEYEVVSALRKAMIAGLLDPEEADQSLQQLFLLGVECIPPDENLHRAALTWAKQLGQPVAYDSQYLALAESLQAEFWTADKRLLAALKGQNIPWLYSVGGATNKTALHEIGSAYQPNGSQKP